MPFWSKKAPSVSEASALMERMTEAQAKQVEIFSNFLGVLSELSARKAASIMGQRSGRARRQKRAAAAGNTPSSSSCPLCINPLHSPVTVGMIQEHDKHAASQRVPAQDGLPFASAGDDSSSISWARVPAAASTESE